MGRPRKPTRLKILDGDRKDRINRDEPQPKPGLGDAPEWFDDHAKLAWARLKERLDAMGVSTVADEEAVTVYCQSYSTWRQALDSVQAEGLMVTSTTSIPVKGGSITRTVRKANPLLPTVRQAARQMMACLTQFGMTPSSRSGLHVTSQPEDDPLLNFLGGSRPKATGNTDGKRGG